MMLRARVDLNEQLPQARTEEIFPTATLDFIHRKSCESIAIWKKLFQKHCSWIKNERDKIIDSFGNISDQSDLRTIVQKMIDQYQDAYHQCTRRSICEFIWTNPDKAPHILGDKEYFDQMMRETLYYPTTVKNMQLDNPLQQTIVRAVDAALSYIHKTATDYFCLAHIREFRELENLEIRLKSMQEGIEKHAPEAAKKLHDHKQSLLSVVKEDLLRELNFDGILTYFKDISASSAFCPPLLNPTIQPLHGALESCAAFHIA